jgi:hypothetical protein
MNDHFRKENHKAYVMVTVGNSFIKSVSFTAVGLLVEYEGVGHFDCVGILFILLGNRDTHSGLASQNINRPSNLLVDNFIFYTPSIR